MLNIKKPRERKKLKSFRMKKYERRLDTNIFFIIIIRVVYALKTCFRRISDTSISLKLPPVSARDTMSFIKPFIIYAYVVCRYDDGERLSSLSFVRRILQDVSN